MRFKKFKSKFSNAKKTRVDGILFDSKLESDRYIFLKGLQRSGKIQNLKIQVPFELIEKQKKGSHKIPSVCYGNSKTIRAVKYYADFVYMRTKDLKWVVNDSKGRTTDVYKIKMKLFIALNGDKYQFLETYRDNKRNNFLEF